MITGLLAIALSNALLVMDLYDCNKEETV